MFFLYEASAGMSAVTSERILVSSAISAFERGSNMTAASDLPHGIRIIEQDKNDPSPKWPNRFRYSHPMFQQMK
jgi:hypothetical protein